MRFLPRVIFSLIGNSVLFWALHEHFFPGEFVVTGEIKGFVVLAVLFGLVNFFVKPLVDLVTLPIRWLTLGLFQFVINAALIYLLEWITHSFGVMEVTLTLNGDWLLYVIVGAIVAFANAVLHWFER